MKEGDVSRDCDNAIDSDLRDCACGERSARINYVERNDANITLGILISRWYGIRNDPSLISTTRIRTSH